MEQHFAFGHLFRLSYSQAARLDLSAADLVDLRDARTTGSASSNCRNLSDKIVQLANAARPSAVSVCVLVNKPRMTNERYTPFGMCSDTPRQTLANAAICNLVRRVTGQRLLTR